MTVSSKENHMWDNQYSQCLCESVAGRRPATPSQTRLMPAFRVSTGLHVKYRRPKAGDASNEGLLKVEKREFRCLGVWMKVSLDETGFGRKCYWTKPFLDESVIG